MPLDNPEHQHQRNLWWVGGAAPPPAPSWETYCFRASRGNTTLYSPPLHLPFPQEMLDEMQNDPDADYDDLEEAPANPPSPVPLPLFPVFPPPVPNHHIPAMPHLEPVPLAAPFVPQNAPQGPAPNQNAGVEIAQVATPADPLSKSIYHLISNTECAI